MLDFYFYYKFLCRNIFILKYSNKLFHYTDIIKFQRLIIFFNIKNLIDLNSSSIISYIYFFKYYFGIIPFFCNYSHEFKLNIHYFNFLIEYVFKDKQIYFPLFFFLNDIYYMINKLNIFVNRFDNYWEYFVNDMNFFLEKKNSLGFFNLKHIYIFNFFLKKIVII